MAEFNLVVEEVLGYVFSEDGVYEPHEITFTVEEGRRVEIGDIVCIEHPSKPGTPVFYQVTEVPLRRKARDYEEDLARLGRPIIDSSRNYPRARARQIGYYEEIMEFSEIGEKEPLMLIEHIIPLTPVYRPKSTILETLLHPSAPSIELGEIYPSWKLTLKLELPKLLRQGLLVVGGVGTGTTTTMLSILVSLVREVWSRGGKPHILIVDKDGEYGVKELLDAVGFGEYYHVDVDEVRVESIRDKERYAREVLRRLGYYDRRSKAAKALYNTIMELEEEDLFPTPDFIASKIIPRIREHDVRGELLARASKWKAMEWGRVEEEKVSIGELVEKLKSKTIVHVDLSKCRNIDRAFRTLRELLARIYGEVLRDECFGCIIVVDEAHLYCPERGGIEISEGVRELKKTIELIATTGPRNGVTLFMATQRPSLISKTITTQLGQNIIAHKVEDVDLDRIREIMGPVATKIAVLPRGWALVKSLATKIRQPLIVRVRAVAKPASTGKTAYERFHSNIKSENTNTA